VAIPDHQEGVRCLQVELAKSRLDGEMMP